MDYWEGKMNIGKIFNAEEVQAIIAGDKTQLILYSIDYKRNGSSVKKHRFDFSNNQKFDDYLFLKDIYSPRLFLEKNEPSSTYYLTSYKVNGVPVRYVRSSYDPEDLKQYSAIVVNSKGNMQPLKYDYTAKGFGYTGYISEDNTEFYLNREEAEIVIKQDNIERANLAINHLLKQYPEAEKILKEKYERKIIRRRK